MQYGMSGLIREKTRSRLFARVRKGKGRQSSWRCLRSGACCRSLVHVFFLMVILVVTTGLRRSELFALKWRDVDFSTLMLDVQRSIYLGKIGHCKTEASRKPVPVYERVAADLWLWRETS